MSVQPANIPALTNYHNSLPVVFNLNDYTVQTATMGDLIDYANLYQTNIFTQINNFIAGVTANALVVTGTSTVPTQATSDNSQSIANTTWVRNFLTANNYLTNAIWSTAETISNVWTFNNNLFLSGNINGNGTNRNLIVGLNSCQNSNSNSNFNNNVVLGDAAAPNLGSGTNNAYWNVLIGNSVASNLTSGLYNVAIGVLSMASSVRGTQNVAIGVEALQNATANNNTAVGHQAGQSLTSGSNNTFIGFQADTSNSSVSNSIAIAGTVSQSNEIVIGTALHTTTFGGNVNVKTPASNDNSTYAVNSSWVRGFVPTYLTTNNYLTSAIWSSNETITGIWNFTNQIKVPTLGITDSTTNAASTSFVNSFVSNAISSLLSSTESVTGLWTFQNATTFNGTVDVNEVFQTYENAILTWNQTKTLGLSLVPVATISFTVEYNQTVTVNTPVSLYRSYHNVTANINLANRIYDTLNSVTYNIYKNSNPWASGTCTYNNTIPNTQIFMGSSSSTSSQSYEIYITNVICSFKPDISSSTDSYVVYYTFNYSSDTSYQAFNFVSDSFGYYVNTSVSTDVIVGNGVINSGGYGSSYSAMALTTNIVSSTNSGTGLLDANNISCNELAVNNVVDNFNTMLTSSSTLVQNAAFTSIMIPRAYFAISVTKGSPVLTTTRYSIPQMNNTMVRVGTGQYRVTIYQNSYAPYITAPDSTYITSISSGSVYSTYIPVQVSGADGYIYNGYVQVDKTNPNNWVWYAYVTMQNGLGTYNEPSSGTFYITAVCFW